MIQYIKNPLFWKGKFLKDYGLKCKNLRSAARVAIISPLAVCGSNPVIWNTSLIPPGLDKLVLWNGSLILLYLAIALAWFAIDLVSIISFPRVSINTVRRERSKILERNTISAVTYCPTIIGFLSGKKCVAINPAYTSQNSSYERPAAIRSRVNPLYSRAARSIVTSFGGQRSIRSSPRISNWSSSTIIPTSITPCWNGFNPVISRSIKR